MVCGNWQQTLKLEEVFKIARALTDIQVDLYYFETTSYATKVLRQLWSVRSEKGTQSWTPENPDQAVRHYLYRRGFTTTRHPQW